MKNHHLMYDLCKQHMHSYVLAETTDGTKFDGIITGLDKEYVYFAVPVDPTQPGMDPQYPGTMGQAPGYEPQLGAMGQMPEHHQHQGMMGQMPHTDGQFRYGYPGYGYGYPGYGYGYDGRPRRFNRLVLPLAALTALSILPWY